MTKKTKGFIDNTSRHTCEDCVYCELLGNGSNKQKIRSCTKLKKPFQVLLDDTCDEIKLKLPQHLEVTLNYFNLPTQQIDIDKIINVYTYGSINYNTQTESSDVDYIIVYDQLIDVSDTLHTKIGNMSLDATLISPEHFKYLLHIHSIDSLECMFIPYKHKFERELFNIKIDKKTLRRSISSISSNSWVKAKKKLIQGDNLIGYKSLFHSLRIVDFGIQLAKNGKISSFTKPYSDILKYNTYSDLLNEIKTFKDWESLLKKYIKTYNNLRSEFKIYAPKY